MPTCSQHGKYAKIREKEYSNGTVRQQQQIDLTENSCVCVFVFFACSFFVLSLYSFFMEITFENVMCFGFHWQVANK